MVLLDVVDEGLVHQMGAPRGGVIAAEVPVAVMVRDGLMQPLEALEDQLDLGASVLGAQELDHLGRDLLGTEGGVDRLDDILYLLRLGALAQLEGALVLLLDEGLHTALLDQGDGGAKGDELPHLAHVDAVIVRVAYLRAAGDDNNLARGEAVEDADDALA